MKYAYRFQKILELREMEKDQSLEAYQLSVADFEQAAEKLYTCLKKKEMLEEKTLFQLNSGMPVQEIRHFQQFVSNLEKTISHYQHLTASARERMNEKQQVLTEKNIEVKKYEKMREKHREVYVRWVKDTEIKSMDDLSVQSYAVRGN
ncbi:flagellar export protein FliJ [Metabacillus indicus]|uniref:flagellar export protein FliJ n=1 Tax=Metabacillus indicus TaxID=246786 RepID=UPI002A066237|nr:flagellar export protein FliJ [Metabacillus indicus]MDX8288365.1 flagellar export protein FliJ [Metabacillus indicus]